MRSSWLTGTSAPNLTAEKAFAGNVQYLAAVENSDPLLEALAVYGTLAPGGSNHWVVSRIQGQWEQGVARGYSFEITWGPAEGYEGFLPANDGHDVAVWLVRSSELAKKWREIDDFEGDGYERQLVSVTTASGEVVEAHMFVALTNV